MPEQKSDSPSLEKRTRPELKPMKAEGDAVPESRIGERITYARNGLNLSVEALSRYSKKFDSPDFRGIPATTLLRYEKGDSAPGARELRILCTALNVSPRWLLLGELENAGRDHAEQMLLSAMSAFVRTKANELRFESGETLAEIFDPYSDDKRLKWLEEARHPSGNTVSNS